MSIFSVSRSPRAVLFGAGQRHALPDIVLRYGQRVWICSDSRIGEDERLMAMVVALKDAGLVVEVFDGTVPELPRSNIEEAASLGRRFKPDVIVGLGGGSCLDMAKLTALQLSHDGPLSAYYGENKVPGPLKPVVAIPTTAGTGSEVTPVAVLDDPERATKVGISSPYLIPEVALCDPELTLSCPSRLTAIAGADALTHAIEAYTAVHKPMTPGLALQQVFVGKNSASDLHATAAITALAGHLQTAVEDGSNLEARAQVMFGALQAGLAFGVAGTAAAHAIQYPVGALTKTPHGAGVAALMPYVMQFNRAARLGEMARIAGMFGIEAQGRSQEAMADEAILAVERLLRVIGIPTSLQALGMKPDQINAVAEQSMQAARLVNNNPQTLDVDRMKDIVQAAYEGRRDLLIAD